MEVPMHTTKRSILTSLFAASALVAACGGSTSSSLTNAFDGGGDGSKEPDGATKAGPDAGHTDAHATTDARTPLDSGARGDTGAGHDAGGSADSGTPQDSGGLHHDAGRPNCPPNAPSVGSACPEIGFVCQYGSSSVLGCNQIFLCQASGWTLEPGAGDAGRCSAGGSCPASSPTGTCSVLNEQCSYEGNPGSACQCSFGSPPSDMLHWTCDSLPQGCPTPRPGIGSPCSGPGLDCDYGRCSGGIELKCKDGTWQPVQSGVCPG
jgi:hypothetical protein